MRDGMFACQSGIQRLVECHGWPALRSRGQRAAVGERGREKKAAKDTEERLFTSRAQRGLRRQAEGPLAMELEVESARRGQRVRTRPHLPRVKGHRVTDIWVTTDTVAP